MIILDACTIISFGNVGRLEIIDAIESDGVCVGAKARAEVLRDPARAAMEASIAGGRLTVVSVDPENPAEQEAWRMFDDRPAFRGRGEAEVLALAATRGYVVASDERAVRTAVREQLGAAQLAGTADFIVWAVREARLSIAEAETALTQLDSGAAVLAQLQRQGLTLRDLVGTDLP